VNTLDRPTVPEVAPLVRAYNAKPGNGAGGSLHVVLDDGNIGDESIRFAIERAVVNGDEDGAALGRILLRMSKTGRKKVRYA
jgi:hypothetical protein